MTRARRKRNQVEPRYTLAEFVALVFDGVEADDDTDSFVRERVGSHEPMSRLISAGIRDLLLAVDLFLRPRDARVAEDDDFVDGDVPPSLPALDATPLDCCLLAAPEGRPARSVQFDG